MDWVPMDTYLARYLLTPEERATVLASSFSASLELVREGQLEVRQSAAFAPLLMRRRSDDGKPLKETE
jgi:segregation and condensation protein A